ncbi:unnamed protein product [Nesidiocoris tenuis]|uniref:Uncharacterized protein n=1 Tax=Nesidiocoris tenuis TaxID=355587 RepID=A0A6H5GJG8_9HEMI|nr:unnamed protein product [Nesidiocoris tenuis]
MKIFNSNLRAKHSWPCFRPGNWSRDSFNEAKTCGNTADSVVSQEIRDVISYEAAYSFAELSMLIILLSDDYGGSGKTHYGGNSVTATIIMASPE